MSYLGLTLSGSSDNSRSKFQKFFGLVYRKYKCAPYPADFSPLQFDCVSEHRYQFKWKHLKETPAQMCLVNANRVPSQSYPLSAGVPWYLALAEKQSSGMKYYPLNYNEGRFHFVDENPNPNHTVKLVVPVGTQLKTNDIETRKYLQVGNQLLVDLKCLPLDCRQAFLSPYDLVSRNQREIESYRSSSSYGPEFSSSSYEAETSFSSCSKHKHKEKKRCESSSSQECKRKEERLIQSVSVSDESEYEEHHHLDSSISEECHHSPQPSRSSRTESSKSSRSSRSESSEYSDSLDDFSHSEEKYGYRPRSSKGDTIKLEKIPVVYHEEKGRCERHRKRKCKREEVRCQDVPVPNPNVNIVLIGPQCISNCSGKRCDQDNGCGQLCGCPSGQVCRNGQCVNSTPQNLCPSGCACGSMNGLCEGSCPNGFTCSRGSDGKARCVAVTSNNLGWLWCLLVIIVIIGIIIIGVAIYRYNHRCEYNVEVIYPNKCPPGYQRVY